MLEGVRVVMRTNAHPRLSSSSSLFKEIACYVLIYFDSGAHLKLTGAVNRSVCNSMYVFVISQVASKGSAARGTIKYLSSVNLYQNHRLRCYRGAGSTVVLDKSQHCSTTMDLTRLFLHGGRECKLTS